MNYIILLSIWCLASLISISVIITRGSYDITYMIHFFIGAGIIMIYGILEARRKDKELNKLR